MGDAVTDAERQSWRDIAAKHLSNAVGDWKDAANWHAAEAANQHNTSGRSNGYAAAMAAHAECRARAREAEARIALLRAETP